MKTCYNCARKHIGKAVGLLQESVLGYPVHRDLAIGELALAESELVVDQPALANAIRTTRTNMLEVDSALPFDELISFLEMIKQIREHTSPIVNP